MTTPAISLRRDLLRLQMEANFYGHCFTCGELVPPERLLKGADTCKPDCQTEKRKRQRRFQKLVQAARFLASSGYRQALKQAGRSAPRQSEAVSQ